MFDAWVLLFLPLLGARAFMIHNTQCSLCLEESAAIGEVLLKSCNLDSQSQQWIWNDRGMLMCVASSRCLSALQREPVRTRSCWGSEVDATGLIWDCDRGRLISRNTSMLLSVDGSRLILTHDSKESKWRSLDEGDICQEKLRSRRASDDPDEFEAAGQTGEQASMTEEQREYLRWYYRTEDENLESDQLESEELTGDQGMSDAGGLLRLELKENRVTAVQVKNKSQVCRYLNSEDTAATTWKFVLLGLALVCLLVGFLLLGMGAMANKNRKKIAKYKAAAAAVAQKGEELQSISLLRDDSSSNPSPSLDRLMQGNKPSPSNGEASELKAGNIVVTWKDGNTSSLYSDPAAEEEKQEEEGSADEEVKTME